MKQKISIAANRPKPKDLSRNHYTTLGFGQIFPIFAEEVVNKDKFNVKVGSFARVAPMVLPNLGQISLKLHAFYVPFRLVWNHYENFKEGLPSWTSDGAQVYKNVPKISAFDLTRLLVTGVQMPQDYYVSSVNFSTEVQSGDEVCDFSTLSFYTPDSAPNTYKRYKLTIVGKQILHILNGLGYRWNLAQPYNQNELYLFRDNSVNNYENVEFSLLPLLCYFKAYLDYFIPSQLQPSSTINQLLSLIHDLSANEVAVSVGQDSSPTANIMELIGQCLYLCLPYYQNNYFTSAWQYPNAPVSGLQNIGTQGSDIPVINSVDSQTSDPSVVNQPLSNTSEFVSNSNAFVSELSSDGLSFLQKFARFVRRGNFAGSRAVERILARFGVHVDDFQIGMSRYLGSDTVALQISDVTNQGNNAELGDFAGKSWFAGNPNRVFKADCDLAGYFIILASIETPSMFTDGIRKRMRHLTPLDYYTPELDGGQMQAISKAEIFQDDRLGLIYNTKEKFKWSDVFGFTPRYSEYKFAIDDISGDFSIPRLSQNIDGFILPRRLFNLYDAYYSFSKDDFILIDKDNGYMDYPGSYNFPQLNPNYDSQITPVSAMVGSDMNQFNRIFRDTTGEADPFFFHFDIKCLVNSVTLPLNESAELIGKGKSLDFETNGVHL